MVITLGIGVRTVSDGGGGLIASRTTRGLEAKTGGICQILLSCSHVSELTITVEQLTAHLLASSVEVAVPEIKSRPRRV